MQKQVVVQRPALRFSFTVFLLQKEHKHPSPHPKASLSPADTFLEHSREYLTTTIV